jgi:glycosyltransferase involved in cell wall biosynthesis
MRILLLARHYPPAISGGARRPFLLTQGLRALGHEVFVVAPSLPEGERGASATHPNRDPSAGPPADKSLRDHARDWLLWPDPDIRWTLRAARLAAEKAPWKPDWVWTTAPPESIHAGGLYLKRKFGARWLADFRDHWLNPPLRKERFSAHRQFGERIIARRWLREVDLLTCVDSFIAGEMKALGAREARVLAHFAPPAQLFGVVALSAEDINIVHSGSLELSDPARRIEAALAAFEAALVANPRLKLHFVGRLSEGERAQIAASKAAARICDHGDTTLEASLGYQRAADGLLLVGSPKSPVPPSKLVEYLATDRPVFLAGDGEWRNDRRLAGCEDAAQMAQLQTGARRAGGEAIRTAPEAAKLLAEWLQSVR